MISIRPLESQDWPQVKRIYLEGIATGKATFQTSAPEWEDWDKSHLANLRFVAQIDDRIAGWIALSPVSSRCVYAGVAEVSVYIGENFRGRNIGYQLLKHIITESEKANIWTLQSSIFSINEASIKLHQKAGFRVIGYRERIGKLNNTWYDNTILEKRSKLIGM